MFEPFLNARPLFPTASMPQKPPHLPPTLRHPRGIPARSRELAQVRTLPRGAKQGETRAGGSATPCHEQAAGAAVGLRAVSPAPRVVFGGEAAGRQRKRRAAQGGRYLLHSSTSASRSSLLGFFWRS